MKVIFNHILFGLLALLTLFTACHRVEPTPTMLGYIFMDPRDAGETRALLDGASFVAPGNQVTVYDYYVPGSQSTAISEGYYIDAATVQSNGTSWPFTDDGERYEWTQDGVHKFFGWLAKDNNGSGLNADVIFRRSLGFDKKDHILTVPSTTVSPTSNQFDFMYSDIHVRNLNTNPDFTPVPLAFSHLFTAFNIAAKDVSLYNDYIIDYVELTGMVVTNSASIDYSVEGPEPTLTYGTGEEGDAYRLEHTGGIQLGENFIDLSTGETTREYLLAWPQAARAMKLTICYQAKDISVEGSQYHTYTKTITIPYAWVQGMKNNLNLEFKDKEIALVYEVEPWNREPEEIDFSDEVMVDEGAHIKWDESSVQHVDYVNGEVIVFDDKNIEATCTFTILTPKGATWTASLISKEGHPDAFRLVDGSKYGNVGGESTLKLVVTNQDPISPRHVCELLITVQTADGRTIVVDDALTPETAYDEETGTYVETTYTRFKIIQNFVN